jgi:hypothetical protein
MILYDPQDRLWIHLSVLLTVPNAAFGLWIGAGLAVFTEAAQSPIGAAIAYPEVWGFLTPPRKIISLRNPFERRWHNTVKFFALKYRSLRIFCISASFKSIAA